jgi:hypothetical protein
VSPSRIVLPKKTKILKDLRRPEAVFDALLYPFAPHLTTHRFPPKHNANLKTLASEASLSASLEPSDQRGAENRRSTRVIHAVPITIRGVDALGQKFEEFTSTVTVNCNGCKYESKHYVPKGSTITIEIGARQRGKGSRLFPARVVWVQRPRTYREVFHIALEFEVPGNVWDIKSPPKDWFPHPDDEELIIPVYPEEGEPIPVLIASGHLAQESEAVANMAATAQAFLAATATAPAPTPSVVSATLDYPSSSPTPTPTPTPMPTPMPTPTNDPELEVARQIVRSNVEAAMREEVALLRQLLESKLQESVQEIVKSLSERISERVLNAVVEQTAERTAATVAEARENGEGTTEELDAKILSAAREALNAQGLVPRTSRKRSRKAAK